MSDSAKDALEVLHVVGGTSQEGGVMAFAKTVATNATPGFVHRIWKHRDYQPPRDTSNLWACAGRASETDVSLTGDVLGAMRDLPHLVKWIRHRPHVVLHAHSRLGTIAAALAARITGAPLIAHAHATPRHPGLYHQLWRFSHATPVFNSWRTCRHFGFDPATATLLPPPIAWPEFPAQALSVDDHIMRFTVCSAFVRLKNLHLIAAAFNEICGSGKKAELRLYGRSSKPLDEDYQVRIVAEAQENSAVHIIDWQTDWARRLTAFDVFVHAAMEESFGIVILEAFARGCHVIVPPGTFLEDLDSSSLRGITIVDPRNTTTLAKAMQRASNEARNVSASSLWQTRLRFAEQFSVRHCQSRLAELYRQRAQLNSRPCRSEDSQVVERTK